MEAGLHPDHSGLDRSAAHRSLAGTRFWSQGQPALSRIGQNELRADMDGLSVDSFGKARCLFGAAFLSADAASKAPVAITLVTPTRSTIRRLDALDARLEKDSH